MSSRHTRRKRSKERHERKMIGLAQAERSRQIAEIVKKNKSSPIERNYYPSSCIGRMAELSHRVYICRPSRSGPSHKVSGFWTKGIK